MNVKNISFTGVLVAEGSLDAHLKLNTKFESKIKREPKPTLYKTNYLNIFIPSCNQYMTL